jgi:transcriptional regulator with XRE-family HTH domain
MTHFQRVFIQNLRFLRSERRISQMKLSELVNITPNYLNAVENGKNFPSPEVVQRIIEVLEVLPYQLFLEQPSKSRMAKNSERTVLLQEIIHFQQDFNRKLDRTLEKYSD